MTYDLAPDDSRPPPPDRETTIARTQRLPRPERIDTQVRCMDCGYVLFGQKRAGRCSECGTPVYLSEAGEQLVGASPRWLQGMCAGLTALLWSVVVLLGAVIIEYGTPVFGAVLHVAAAALALWGVVALTRPEPSSRTRSGWTLGGALRWAAAVRSATAVLLIGSGLGLSAVVLQTCYAVNAVLSVLMMIGICILLRGLAARTDDVELERRTTVLAWMTLGCAALIVICSPLFMLLGGRSAAPPMCVAVLAALALVACSVVFLRLLASYRHLFKWAAHESEVARLR